MSAICNESHHRLQRRLATVGRTVCVARHLRAHSVPLRASCGSQGLKPRDVALEVTGFHPVGGFPFMLDHHEGAKWPQWCNPVRVSPVQNRWPDSITTAHSLAPILIGFYCKSSDDCSWPSRQHRQCRKLLFSSSSLSTQAASPADPCQRTPSAGCHGN